MKTNLEICTHTKIISNDKSYIYVCVYSWRPEIEFREHVCVCVMMVYSCTMYSFQGASS